MRLSIRNRLGGTVTAVHPGPAMTTVHTRLSGGQDVTAAITSESAADLDLTAGSGVELLIKSTEVSVALDAVDRLSIRNRFAGTIESVDHGEVMTTVKIAISGGDTVTAAITRESARELELAAGLPVTALVKSTDVALARFEVVLP